MHRPPAARHRLAWWLPLVAVWVVDASAPDIEHSFGVTRAVAFSLLLGLAAGAAWYRLHPRTLANRLTPVAMLTVLVVVLAAFMTASSFDLSSADIPKAYCLVGVLVGLVLAEQWIEGGVEHRAIKAFKASRP
ncbi:MAG: hypothetical protein ACR2FG_08035 [Marmoricola sp.]